MMASLPNVVALKSDTMPPSSSSSGWLGAARHAPKKRWPKSFLAPSTKVEMDLKKRKEKTNMDGDKKTSLGGSNF
jgi:hypothetical protein